MNFEIKSRSSGSVLFALETENLRLCVEAAVKSGADLPYADLPYADLPYANLSCANLFGANLFGANDEKLILAGARPIIQIGPLGSRCAYLLAFMTGSGIYVRAGCFWDTIETFKAAVEKEHGNNIYGEEYAAAITLIKAHAKLWTPKEPSNG